MPFLDLAIWGALALLGDGARWARSAFNVALVMLVVFTALLSASRSAALHLNFAAPLQVYGALYYQAPSEPVCVGKEWYRFPSSFFLPRHAGTGRAAPLLWLNSSFRGQLPRPFEPWPGGLSINPPAMNDRNAEEVSRYSKLSDCSLVIDLVLPLQKEPPLDSATWEPIRCERFLDAERSRLPWRAFHVPFGISQARNAYIEYCVWRRRRSVF